MKSKIIEKTNGKKTKAVALIGLIISLLGDNVPFIQQNKETVLDIFQVLIASGLLHDFWRNRKKIIDWLNIFSKKDRGGTEKS